MSPPTRTARTNQRLAAKLKRSRTDHPSDFVVRCEGAHAQLVIPNVKDEPPAQCASAFKNIGRKFSNAETGMNVRTPERRDELRQSHPTSLALCPGD
jgi:hypothetical protein